MLTIAVLAAANLTAQNVQVYDTVSVKDRKLDLITQGAQWIETEVKKQASEEKTANQYIPYKAETNQFLNQLAILYYNYKNALVKVDSINYELINGDYYQHGDTLKSGMIAEYNQLNARLAEIENDPEITYQDGNKAKATIQARQAVLFKRYKQIQQQ